MLFDKDMLPFCDRVMLNHVSNEVLLLNKSLWYSFHSYCAPGLTVLFHLIHHFLGYTVQTLTDFHEELTVWFVSSGAAVHGPNVLWSTLPIQRSTTETTSIEFPSMLEIVYVCQI